MYGSGVPLVALRRDVEAGGSNPPWPTREGVRRLLLVAAGTASGRLALQFPSFRLFPEGVQLLQGKLFGPEASLAAGAL